METNIPKEVKLMDSGTARFSLDGGLVDAVNHVMTLISSEGGNVRKTDTGSIVADFSTAWRYSFITAVIEPSGEGWAASFKEANCGTPLRNCIIAVITLILLTATVLLFHRIWSILLVFAILFAYILLRFAPHRPCKYRMERIISLLNTIS